MIKIEFPADRKDIALAIGKALTEIGQGAVVPAAAVDSVEVGNDAHTETSAASVTETQTAAAAGATSESTSQTSSDAADTGGATDPNADSTSQAATQEQKAAGAHAAGDGVQVDEKGVPFNGEFCGKAAVPFYGSGKKKGQWKKRQGVDEDAYDEWYAEALLGANIVEEEPEDTAQTETTSDGNIAASMFAASDAQNAAAGEDVPQDAGQLMKWVSEQQAAGNITQQQVTDAYTALQLPFDAVMNPAYPVADNCAAIYNHLKGQIG